MHDQVWYFSGSDLIALTLLLPDVSIIGIQHLLPRASSALLTRFYVLNRETNPLVQILGFVYLSMLQLPGSVCMMVWGSITCVFLLLLAMGYGLSELGMCCVVSCSVMRWGEWGLVKCGVAWCGVVRYVVVWFSSQINQESVPQ